MSILLAPVHLRGSLRSPIAFKIGIRISDGSFLCPASIRARSEACVCGTEIWLYHQLKQVEVSAAKEHWITGIAQPCSETCRPLMPNMPANMQTLLAVSSPRKHRISVRTRIQCIIAQIICYTTGKITTFPCAPLQHAPTRPKAVTVKIYTGPI